MLVDDAPAMVCELSPDMGSVLTERDVLAVRSACFGSDKLKCRDGNITEDLDIEVLQMNGLMSERRHEWSPSRDVLIDTC